MLGDRHKFNVRKAHFFNVSNQLFCKLTIGIILRKRGELDNLPDLVTFAEKLETACIQTLNDGIMTKDLTGLVIPEAKATVKAVNSKDFIAAIRERLQSSLS